VWFFGGWIFDCEEWGDTGLRRRFAPRNDRGGNSVVFWYLALKWYN